MPGLFLILAGAFWGASGAIGGAIVMFAYLLFTLGAPERFPHFFANPGMLAFWVFGFGGVTAAAVLLRARLLRAHAQALAAAQDQTELAALTDYRQWLNTIVDNAPALIGYIDAKQRFKFHNLTFESWLDKPKSEITGRDVREVFGETEYQKIKPHLERALRGGRVTFHHELRLHGEVRHAQTNYVPDFETGGRVRGCFVVAMDVGSIFGEQREEQRAPSGIATEGQLVERLRRALTGSQRGGAPLALLHVALDRSGEELLTEVAGRLRACVRGTDTVARVGAGQFAVLLEGLKERSHASLVSEKIRRALHAPIPAGGGEVRLTASIGVAFAEGADAAPEDLIRRAGSGPAHNQPPSSFEPID